MSTIHASSHVTLLEQGSVNTHEDSQVIDIPPASNRKPKTRSKTETNPPKTRIAVPVLELPRCCTVR